ncbi:MAG TPA: chaperone modulator CbpM [Steroidobacteraceae bacterium]|nr:chaperone modulator CbpM [Steroidobacteraceae bacterium]
MTGETDVMWLDEHRLVTLAELVQVSGLSERELLELVQGGAIAASGSGAGGYTFSARVITVARTACRLRDDLELDVRGLGVALRLLERVSELEAEISQLRAQLPSG